MHGHRILLIFRLLPVTVPPGITRCPVPAPPVMGDDHAGNATVFDMMRTWQARMLLIAMVVLDQATKLWASDVLAQGALEIPGPLDLRLVRNTGAAFGTLPNMTPLLTTLGTVAAIGAWFLLGRNIGWHRVGWALVGAGAAGNLLDRLFRDPAPGFGAVVDFLAVGSFPVFNIADIAVCTGAAILALVTLRPSPDTSGT